MSASPAPKQQVTLPHLAREVMSQHGGDTHAAAAALADMLMRDRKLLLSLIEPVLRDCATYRAEHSMRHQRAAIMQAANSRGRGAVIAMANGIVHALLDMPLAGGLRLREAGRQDVLDQAQRYSAQAIDMARKARWLTAIAKLMGPGQRVGDVITEERAHALLQEASK